MTLSDHDHPRVRAVAIQLTSAKMNHIEKLNAIFSFVRDEIRFGFPPKWDQVKASETLDYHLGTATQKQPSSTRCAKPPGSPHVFIPGLLILPS